MLRWRLALGAIIIAALVGLFWLDYHASLLGVALLPLALIVTLLGTGETLQICDAVGLHGVRLVSYGGGVLLWLSCAIGFQYADSVAARLAATLLAFVLASMAGVTVVMAQYQQPGENLRRIAGTLIPLAYVGLGVALLTHLRGWGDRERGTVALVSVIVVTKLGDIGAYTLGRLFGRHKLVPRLSPGKTWEGVAGAILFSTLGSAWVFFQLAPRLVADFQPSTWTGVILFGVLVCIAGICGDLAESLLKRDAGRKDSSDWMPGFGGVLDLLDSLLAAAPVALVLWMCGIVRA
jgi:phosphatidate cytidylyltransferase